jgi:hypothetical protein
MATLREIETHWSLVDLHTAHWLLDQRQAQEDTD